MSTMAISKNNTVTMNKVNAAKKATLTERFKEYFLNNAAWFAASAAMQTGNSYAACQIMRNK